MNVISLPVRVRNLDPRRALRLYVCRILGTLFTLTLVWPFGAKWNTVQDLCVFVSNQRAFGVGLEQWLIIFN